METFSKLKDKNLVIEFIIAEVKKIIDEKAKYIAVDKNMELSALDSIEIAQLAGSLEQRAGNVLKIEQLYKVKNIEELSDYVLQNAAPSPIETAGSNLEDLGVVLSKVKNMRLKQRATYFTRFLNREITENKLLIRRRVLSASDRTVRVYDDISHQERELVMFGSNNYLGLANHPYVKQKIHEAVDRYGSGMAGSSLLNGYANAAAALEEKLAAFKGAEAAMLFSSGYNANVGGIGALLLNDSVAVSDELIHASIIDGLKLAHKPVIKFQHNNIDELDSLLNKYKDKEVFVLVEGVYSMDGDICPLTDIVALCKKYQSLIVIDDAHGLGVLGKTGRGTAEHFNVQSEIDITIGTFSKALAQVGGFICGNKEVVEYLRFYARSYMFSCALPPAVVAGIDAALDLLQTEQWRVAKLHENIAYLNAGLKNISIDLTSESAIFAIPCPAGINVRNALTKFSDLGIFINSVEYPAVPQGKERFRVSISASHSRDDLDRLLEALSKVFHEKNNAI